MSKKKRSRKMNVPRIITNCIVSVVGLVSFIIFVIGLIGSTNVDLMLEKEKLECENKDYSSYVKVNTVETPGNEKINNEIERYENAMNKAREAGDYNALGQLNERYEQLLYMQSQTTTTRESYDYSDVERAKNNCRDIAENHKKTEEIKNTWMKAGGIITFIICAGSISIYNIIASAKKGK